MIVPAKPYNEEDRLKALYDCQILNTPEEPEFNNIVKLASQIAQTNYSLISLIDDNRQWFKAKVGFSGQSGLRDTSFCGHAILASAHGLLLLDTKKDVRFYDNPCVVGEPFIRFYAGFPLITSSGYPIGTLCVFDDKPRDLSEEQEFALRTLSQQIVNSIELRQKVLRLQEANSIIHHQGNILDRHNQSRTKLISMLSHDVRNALLNLKTVLNMFKDGQLNIDEIYNLIEISDTSIDITNELLENLLRWSATQLHSDDLCLQSVSISYLVSEAFSLIQPKSTQKKNQLENYISKETFIKADKEIVRFLLRNIINNANKFTENGHIKVRLEESTDFYYVSVIDTGVGMNADQIDRLFLSRFRSTTNGTSGEKGNGIGLQLCKELIERHGGSLTLKSTKAVGTTFTFSIPKRFDTQHYSEEVRAKPIDTANADNTLSKSAMA